LQALFLDGLEPIFEIIKLTKNAGMRYRSYYNAFHAIPAKAEIQEGV